ncbi:hypothetical protein L211DRAFT_852728 [Terfezia boudieri ATCC MYA-4762]|uniref:Uncharacterized protein n=1 Tax=Terfezia boudieri ATCC MYA-4762 TaxID=1051890 RepID=A0A3N4LH76_9PEZI|nr:hypothetical protein L211DRAFT_852728 [Terfezia boudieri ATCC MYA-4762]
MSNNGTPGPGGDLARIQVERGRRAGSERDDNTTSRQSRCSTRADRGRNWSSINHPTQQQENPGALWREFADRTEKERRDFNTPIEIAVKDLRGDLFVEGVGIGEDINMVGAWEGRKEPTWDGLAYVGREEPSPRKERSDHYQDNRSTKLIGLMGLGQMERIPLMRRRYQASDITPIGSGSGLSQISRGNNNETSEKAPRFFFDSLQLDITKASGAEDEIYKHGRHH